MKRLRSAALLLALAVPALAGAADEAGSRLARDGAPERGTPACQACHGVSGEGRPDANIPRLAGLNDEYLARQLDQFAAGARRNAVMAPIAKGLTAGERRAVARYFALLPVKGLPASAGAAAPDAGRALATDGRWSAGLPPCASCHGPEGLGVEAAVPPLAGQPAGYIEASLADWRDGARRGDPLGLMAGVAKRLTPEQAQAVAAYYAALPAAPGARRR